MKRFVTTTLAVFLAVTPSIASAQLSPRERERAGETARIGASAA